MLHRRVHCPDGFTEESEPVDEPNMIDHEDDTWAGPSRPLLIRRNGTRNLAGSVSATDNIHPGTLELMERVLSELTCPICKEVMRVAVFCECGDADNRVDPQFLVPCGHAVCVPCVTRYIKSLQRREESPKCMLCRQQLGTPCNMVPSKVLANVLDAWAIACAKVPEVWDGYENWISRRK